MAKQRKAFPFSLTFILGTEKNQKTTPRGTRSLVFIARSVQAVLKKKKKGKKSSMIGKMISHVCRYNSSAVAWAERGEAPPPPGYFGAGMGLPRSCLEVVWGLWGCGIPLHPGPRAGEDAAGKGGMRCRLSPVPTHPIPYRSRLPSPKATGSKGTSGATLGGASRHPLPHQHGGNWSSAAAGSRGSC